MDYKLYAVRIFVRDWENAVRFYKETLGMATTFESAELGWAELDTGAAHLAVERLNPEDDDEEHGALVGRNLCIPLSVSDIDNTYATLRDRGVEFLAPPGKQPLGGTLAHFKDPEGTLLTMLGS